MSAQHTHLKRLAAVGIGAVLLAGCAQTNALFDGATGSLSEGSQTVQAQSVGQPPLPAKRRPQPKPEREESGGGLLAMLPDIDLTAQAVAPQSVVAEDTPINVYVRLARQIRQCWLGPTDARLPGHGFRAEAKPGEAVEAEIDIFEKVPGRKTGPLAFEVKITPQGGGSLVRSTNRRVDEELADALRGDIARWVRGGDSCAAGSGSA